MLVAASGTASQVKASGKQIKAEGFIFSSSRFLSCHSPVFIHNCIRAFGLFVWRAKVLPASARAVKVEPQGGFAKNLPLSLRASVFIRQNLDRPDACTRTALETKNDRRDG